MIHAEHDSIELVTGHSRVRGHELHCPSSVVRVLDDSSTRASIASFLVMCTYEVVVLVKISIRVEKPVE